MVAGLGPVGEIETIGEGEVSGSKRAACFPDESDGRGEIESVEMLAGFIVGDGFVAFDAGRQVKIEFTAADKERVAAGEAGNSGDAGVQGFAGEQCEDDRNGGDGRDVVQVFFDGAEVGT